MNKSATVKPNVEALFDARTWTVTYVVWAQGSNEALVIDPVLDFDPANGRIWEESVDRVMKLLEEKGLSLKMVLETHAHADHLSGSQVLKARTGCDVAIGADITKVQAVFAPFFNLGPEFALDGSQFDRLFQPGEVVEVAGLSVEALPTPGHTPACMSFKIGDAVFTGDALFMPDVGVGRCDFPAGSAATLYQSVHETLYTMPDETRVFVGHDYPPAGREASWETTVAASKAANVHLRGDTSAEGFVAFRTQRDAGLAAPRLLLPSIQVNIDAGRLPAAETNGKRYLKLPLR